MKNLKKTQTILILTSLFIIGFAACTSHKDDDHNHTHGNELITTVKLMMIDSLTSDTLNFKWAQIGGPGTTIVLDTILIKQNAVYNCYTYILDESKNPAEDKTNEIKAQANFHQFVYSSTISSLNTTILDKDTHNPPLDLGLNFKLTTGSASTGLFKVKLYHFTNDHKIHTLEHGTTDIEVEFPCIIQKQ